MADDGWRMTDDGWRMTDGGSQYSSCSGGSLMDGSHRDLEVYALAHAMGVRLHKFSLLLPKHELYETGSQLRRASKSVSANIVEGFGRRRYKADFVRLLVYALASFDESVEWLEYVRDCHEHLTAGAEREIEQLSVLGKKLNRFLQAVETGHRSIK
jgi:four helix bundle protein